MADPKRVIIDAERDGVEPGTMFSGRREKDDTLRLALTVGQIPENNGVDVAYTRTTDTFDTPLEKAQIANRSGADYFVPIHHNAMPVPGTGSGVITLACQDESVSAMLAENIQYSLAGTGSNDLGIQERPGLIVLRRTQMPAVLMGTGFIDNPQDNQSFDENFEVTAQAIVDGVLQTIREQKQQRPEYYQVQTGVFRTRMPVQRLVDKLQSRGFPAFMVYDNGPYKVRVGAFLNMDHVVQMERNLRSMGYPAVPVREWATYWQGSARIRSWCRVYDIK